MRVSALPVLAFALALTSCAELPTEPTPEFLDPPVSWDIEPPQCELDGTCTGGGGPATTGLALPFQYRWDACVNPTTDADKDGLDDECEYQIAYAFRPELRFSGAETQLTSMQSPYWAVKRSTGTRNLRVFYALAYVRDWGDFATGSGGHPGDSEFVELTVHYNSMNGTWETVNALLSAHYKTINDRTTRYSFGDLIYVDGRYLGRVRVYVSERKHANYNTAQRCDSFTGDFCGGAHWSRDVNVVRERNLGAAHQGGVKLVNCVYNPDFSGLYGRECFWQINSTFAGWTGESTHTMNYGDILYRLDWIYKTSYTVPCEEPHPLRERSRSDNPGISQAPPEIGTISADIAPPCS